MSDNFAQTIRRWRLSQKPIMLQRDAAKLVGVTRNRWCLWENGQTPGKAWKFLVLEKIKKG